jgi:RNase P protein component
VYRDNTVDKEIIFFIIAGMAKQAGIIKMTGTVNDICFYKLKTEYYARQKSSLSGRRVKKDPAFAETMKYAELLATASRIGSVVYRSLSKEKRERRLYQQLTGMAMQLLKKGMRSDELIVVLRKEAIQLQNK